MSTFTADDTRKLEVTHIYLQLVERLVGNFGMLPVRKHSKHFARDAKPEPEPEPEPPRQFLGTRAGARGHFILPGAEAEQHCKWQGFQAEAGAEAGSFLLEPESPG